MGLSKKTSPNPRQPGEGGKRRRQQIERPAALLLGIARKFTTQEGDAHRRGPSRTLRTATEGALRFGPQRL